MIPLTKTSIISGITRTKELDISEEELLAWQNGLVIQKAMPRLTLDEREFVLTGITPEEWDEFMQNDDYSDECSANYTYDERAF